MSDFDHNLFRQNITLRCSCVAQEQLDPDCEYHGKESRMSEKYFVVSESELEALIISTADTVRASCNDEWRKLEKCEQLADEAEAACRAREVPEGTRFLDCFHTDAMEKLGSIMLWGY